MPGVIVNTVAVMIGSLIGLLCNRSIPSKITDAAMIGIGLCSLYIGISGTLKDNNTIVLVLSTVLGGITGTLLDIDGALNRLGQWVERKFTALGGKKPQQLSRFSISSASSVNKGSVIAKGFVSASLLFCVGSMTIIGSFNAGISGDCTMLYTKSVLDFLSSIMLSVSLGAGVLLSSLFVFVLQGLLVLLSQVLAPVMSDAAIAETVSVGSVAIIGIGLNLLGITKIKVADYLPAMIFAPVFLWIFSFLPAATFGL